MATTDRTLLANLAFADPDKKDPLHDLACQYIAQPSVVNSLGLVNARRHFFAEGVKMRMEYPVSKGRNQYKTTIGFIDVILPVVDDNEDNDDVEIFVVEVKITPVGLGDVLRQINLYREYVCLDSNLPNIAAWILVTNFDMSAAMEEGLRAAGITPFRLGDGFKKFVEEQRASTRPGTSKVI